MSRHVATYHPNSDDLCSIVKFTYIYDNMVTLIYSSCISVWAIVFLEFWKRKNAYLAYKWNIPCNKFDDLDDQPIRCEYVEAANQKRKTQFFKTSGTLYKIGLPKLFFERPYDMVHMIWSI